MPTPRFFTDEGFARFAVTPKRARLSRQPEASTTLSMHSPRPMVVTVRWFAVLVNGSATIRRRISAGSDPNGSAALFGCHSRGKRGGPGPRPRLWARGGVLGEGRAAPDFDTGGLWG